MIEDNNFVYHYVPFSFVTERLKIAEDKIIWAALRGTISLYFPNQSSKRLHYAPTSYLKGWGRLKNFLGIGYSKRILKKGDMVELSTVHTIDLLAKGILTEQEALFINPENGDCLVNSIEPIFRYLHANFLFHKFHPITLDHIYILRADLPELIMSLKEPKQLDAGETESEDSLVLTKQEQRELIFYEWLTDKDEQKVSQMKKEEVLAELRKINPHLFMGDQKHFFRQQKRITFKSGRKAESDD